MIKLSNQEIGNPIRIGRHMKPTKQHRPAVWEGILGTVYAQDDQGVIEYFEYDWAGALAYAGVNADRDPRYWRSSYSHPHCSGYAKGQLVLYVRREQTR